jgi:hypothetical protein
MVEPVCAADSVEVHLSLVFVGRHVTRTALLLLQSGTVCSCLYIIAKPQFAFVCKADPHQCM